MTVVAMRKDNFNVVQYSHVSRIDYDADTKIYTITYGNSQTVTVNGNNYVISVLFS